MPLTTQHRHSTHDARLGILECAASGEQNPRRLTLSAVARYEAVAQVRRRSAAAFYPRRDVG
jgi:hypothetical protein